MDLIVSNTYPYVLSGILTLILFLLKDFIPFNKLESILPQTMTLGGIIVGFFSTALAILYSISGTKEIVAKIKTAGYFSLIIDYLLQAIYFGFILSGISALGLFLNFNHINYIDFLYFHSWFYLFSCAILLSFRVIKLFGKMLKSSN